MALTFPSLDLRHLSQSRDPEKLLFRYPHSSLADHNNEASINDQHEKVTTGIGLSSKRHPLKTHESVR
jgi:hypothetical protein